MIVDPVGPEVPAALAPLLTSMRDAIMELLAPTQPRLAFRSTVAGLPRPASDWEGCVADVTDLATLAKSDGTDWRRIDTGAPI